MQLKNMCTCKYSPIHARLTMYTTLCLVVFTTAREEWEFWFYDHILFMQKSSFVNLLYFIVILWEAVVLFFLPQNFIDSTNSMGSRKIWKITEYIAK